MNRAGAFGFSLAILALVPLLAGPSESATFTVPVTGSQIVATPDGSARLLVQLGPIEVGADAAIGAATLRLGAMVGSIPEGVRLDVEAISVPWSVGGGTWSIATHEGLGRRVTLRPTAGGLSLDLSHIVRAVQDGTEIYGLVITAPAGNADGVSPAVATAVQAALSQATLEISYRGIPSSARDRRR